MSKQPIIAMIPCRAGSQRVVRKNTRPLPGYPGGLLELKLRQIASSALIDGVVLSTDDPECVAIAESLRPASKPLTIVDRPHEFAIAGPLDDFVRHVAETMPAGVVAWMHVTSPFFGPLAMDTALAAYRDAVATGAADSLMGVSRLQTFLWRASGCISHDRSVVRWPQTQDLEPVYEVNSSIFVADRDLMRVRGDRIGANPLLYPVDRDAAFDIDWPDDFAYLERRLMAGEAITMNGE